MGWLFCTSSLHWSREPNRLWSDGRIDLRVRRDAPTTGTPAPQRGRNEALPAGTVLESRYEIQRVIGRGGMSTVYAARDLRFGHVERLCAIKEMTDRSQDYQTRLTRLANFEREAALLATLSHTAIPKIYDYFTESGLIYLVLEFIDGQDLERVVSHASEPVPEATVIDWGLQILDVLAYLHEHHPEPIVFRDMKPSNIMLRSDGSLSLIDFGIARTFQPMQRGTMIGTEGYAPPEQYRGLAEPRGDIYATGATLHHLATGSDPRTEPPFSFQQRRPRNLRPELSQELEQTILKAVAYEPADRFPSAAAMQQALIDARDARSRPVAPEPKVAEPSHRVVQPTIGPADASTVASEQLHTDRLRWTVQTGDEVRGSAVITRRQAFVGSYDQHLYALDLAEGGIIWRFRANRGIVARPLVVDDRLIVGSEDHTIYALDRLSGRLCWSFRTAMPVRSSAAVFQDAVVVGSDDGYCYCLDVEQGQLLWRLRAWGPIRSSPLVAGTHIIFGSDDGSVYCASAIDGRLTWRHPLGRPVLSSPAPGEQTVVVGCTDGTLYGLDLPTGFVHWSVKTGGPIVASPRVVDDTAIVGSADGRLYAVSVSDGERLWEQALSNQITSSAAIDGARAFVGTIDGNLACVALDTGESLWSYRLGSPIVASPAIADTTVVVGTLDGRIVGIRS